MKTFAGAAIVAFLLSAAATKFLLPVLRKLKAGQNILSYVKEHAGKAGTPSMGGLAFVFACVVCVCIFGDLKNRTLTVSLCLGLAFGFVGFLDDLIKIRRKDNLGLKPYQKIAFQSVAALLAGVYCYRAKIYYLYFPFSSFTAKIGFFIVPLAAFVFLALVNAVNLTDGLDGLAGGSCAAYFLSFAVLLGAQAKGNAALFSGGQANANANELRLLCVCLAAALCGFLLFNTFPARIFMGDTGSLALGGFASSIAVFSGNALFVPVIGITFVLSVITVVLQVIYYKATKGKRIFLMAPLHHHLQKKGYSESKISFAYTAITALCGTVCLLFV